MGAYPGEIYTPSPRAYAPSADPEYPFHDRTARVTSCGRICIGNRKINLSQVFVGQILGLREVNDKTWLVSYFDYNLGFFDNSNQRLYNHLSGIELNHLTRMNRKRMVGAARIELATPTMST